MEILEVTKLDNGVIVLIIIAVVVAAGLAASASFPNPTGTPDDDDDKKKSTDTSQKTVIDLVHRVEVPLKLKIAITACVIILVVSIIGYLLISFHLGTFLWSLCWAPFGFSRIRQFEQIMRNLECPPLHFVECVQWNKVDVIGEFGAEFVEFTNFEGKIFQIPVEFFVRDHTFQLYLVGGDLYDFIYNLTEEQMAIFGNRTLCYDIWCTVGFALCKAGEFLPEGSDEFNSIMEALQLWLGLNEYEAANFMERVFLPRFTLQVAEYGIIECLDAAMNSGLF